VEEHKSFLERKFIDLGRPRKKGDVTREHNSSFTAWFKEKLHGLQSTLLRRMKNSFFALSQGPGHNMRSYQAYDINGYRFYIEERDRSSEYQNSGVMMLSYTDDEATVKERFFGRIEEIWELNCAGEKVPMFHV
jgi:hypothetical protein